MIFRVELLYNLREGIVLFSSPDFRLSERYQGPSARYVPFPVGDLKSLRHRSHGPVEMTWIYPMKIYKNVAFPWLSVYQRVSPSSKSDEQLSIESYGDDLESTMT